MNSPPERPQDDTVRTFDGKPAWITPELVKETLQTWQPRYNAPLTEADAVEILHAFGRLLERL